MALKDFILKGSYTRIDRVIVLKSMSMVEFFVTVYKTKECKDILVKDMRYDCKNDISKERCSCGIGEAFKVQTNECVDCNKTGYVLNSEYDKFFLEALKKEKNILGICYAYLKTKPEFAGTSEV